MTDLALEVATLKAQIRELIGKGEDLPGAVSSIWVVYDPSKIAVWCSKTDCPLLGRETTYDVIKEESEDSDLESIIKTGVSKEESESGDYDSRIKRVSSPKIRYHDLGAIGAFTTKTRATEFIEEYFRLNRETLIGETTPEICLTEVIINS